MFYKTETKSGLDDAIDSVLAEMAGVNADSEEFAKMVDQLDKLNKIKSYDKDGRVSKDTLATVAANLIGIVMILNHERAHVVTSKALGFVLKSKL